MFYLKYLVTLTSFVLFLFPSVSFAFSCDQIKDIGNQIYSDYKTSSINVRQKLYPWQNISWLKQKLGEPNVSTIQETVYKWPNYSLLLQADRPIESSGVNPISNQVGIPSPEAVNQILGKPVSIENFPVTRYEWLCNQPDQNARLTILTDSDNEMFMVDSMACSSSNAENKPEGCQNHSLNLGTSQAHQAM